MVIDIKVTHTQHSSPAFPLVLSFDQKHYFPFFPLFPWGIGQVVKDCTTHSSVVGRCLVVTCCVIGRNLSIMVSLFLHDIQRRKTMINHLCDAKVLRAVPVSPQVWRF